MLASLTQLLDNSNNNSSAVVVVDLHSGKVVAGDAVTQLEVGVVNIVKTCTHQLSLPQETDGNRLRRLVSEVTAVDIMCRYVHNTCRYVSVFI